MRAKTVEEAVALLVEATKKASERGARWGYFSALYTRVTRTVGERIQAGFFEDGPRMERLDVAFANRYFDALDAYLAGLDAPTRAWRAAFEAAERDEATILQHLYLGLNAHLLIDLGVAAAQTCPGPQIHPAKGDFFRINDLVGDLMGGFHADLASVSPVLGRLAHRAGWLWKQGSLAGLVGARTLAWGAAERLAAKTAAEMPEEVERLDRRATLVAGGIARPGFVDGLIWKQIRREETMSVREVIARLS